MPRATGFAMVGAVKFAQAKPDPGSNEGRRGWSAERAGRYALVGLGLPALFLGAGWIFLSTVDGWGGIVLWILFSLPLCFLAEFLLRQRRREKRSAQSLPRMRVRTPARGDSDRARASLRDREPEFRWHREENNRRRRRTYAGR